MRRMRTIVGYLVLVLVPLIAVGFGIRYFVNQTPDHGSDWSALQKLGSPTHKIDDLDADAKESKESRDSKAANQVAAKQEKTKKKVATGIADENAAHGESHGEAVAGREIASGTEPCAGIEFRGEGPHAVHFTEEEWAALRSEFRHIKKDLLAWLEQNKAGFSPESTAFMQKQLNNLKIHRPPVSFQPDLSWRGIATWTLGDDGEPMILVGGGFMKLARLQPQRARFEIARLIAQSWSPCELKRSGAPGATEAWKPLLGCLGFPEQDRSVASDSSGDRSCSPGSYSEAGWAFSSALAVKMADPGCAIPAFQDPALAECINRFPLGGQTK